MVPHYVKATINAKTDFNKDRTGQKQLERTVHFGTKKVEEVESRIRELTELKEEMQELLADFSKRLNTKGSAEKNE
ncbi:hypothetical protein [Sutcliffiella deserti]|uniref:hypothetical protein n=1 Tax=Sutcliffiella deserti TaxID=2875501 RepID=UPI001CBBC7E2|nr:hypothetical protein [Sutcliffiella deserti]